MVAVASSYWSVYDLVEFFDDFLPAFGYRLSQRLHDNGSSCLYDTSADRNCTYKRRTYR